jgi:hypothetical protein
MSIVRRHHNSNFTVVPNAIFEDARLSIEAKGVLGYLLSRPHDWTIHLTQIGNALDIGRDKTERIFRELRDAGYVVRGKQTKQANGAWGAMEFVVFDDPTTPEAQQARAAAPSPENAHTAEPSTAEPYAGNQGTYKELIEPRTDITKATADDARAGEAARSLISPEAHELADHLLRVQHLDRDDHRAIGTAYQAQTWLTKGWRAELIKLGVERVMAKRSTPPTSLRYFEPSIAEMHADQDRQLPIAVAAPLRVLSVGRHYASTDWQGRRDDWHAARAELRERIGK